MTFYANRDRYGRRSCFTELIGIRRLGGQTDERYVVSVQPSPTITYRGFIPSDTDDLVALWEACGLTRTWINSHDEIAIKAAEDPEGLMVAVASGNDQPAQIVGSIMAGYDGHRGWINYLGVHPNWQRQGIARELMRHAEAYLRTRGAPKINLQVRRGNDAVLAFYDQIGYVDDDVIGLGKRLEPEPDA